LPELTSQPGRWAFVITESQDPVAVVDVERDGENPTTTVNAIAVAPSKRRSGIGRRALNAVADRPELARLSEFVGEVEVGNTAAENWVVAAGFERSGMATAAGSPEMSVACA
jgi:ribosomal protein S18 acetylase RimI-like enzyme